MTRLVTLAALAFGGPALAADHAEAPLAAADPAADLADFYAWEQGNDIVAAITFAGLTPAGGDATYDADVLYGIHIDNDGDHVADHDVWVRFGQDGAGDWGMQVQGLPGGDTLEGAVETGLQDAYGLRAWAGLRDDPFFFDLAGFQDTLSTGTLMFDSSRDSLSGTNVTAIVVTMDADVAAGGGSTLSMWATSARK